MWIIDAKYAHPVADPEKDDVLQLFPQLSPLRSLEIQGNNILVFLGWIFRVLDRSIRTFTEPFRMLPHVRMIRRTLERQVERDLDIVRLGLGDQTGEIVQRSQLRIDAGMPALFGSNGPGTADVVRTRGDFIVFAFSKMCAQWDESVEGTGRRNPSRRHRGAVPRNPAGFHSGQARARKIGETSRTRREKAAFSRSTTRHSSFPYRRAKRRSGYRCMMAVSSSPRISCLSLSEPRPWRTMRTQSRSRVASSGAAREAASSTTPAPINHSAGTSVPESIRLIMAFRQVPNRSIQPSTV